MAMLIENMVCRICGQPIKQNDAVRGFGPFVSNESDPLRFFDDSVFHEHCLLEHPLGHSAISRYAAVRKQRDEARICAICHLPITNEQILKYNDFLPLDYLTDNQNSRLARYNLARFHKSCLRGSAQASDLRKALEEGLVSGTWSGKAWSRLLHEVRELETR